MSKSSLSRLAIVATLTAALLGSVAMPRPALATAELDESPADITLFRGATPNVAVGPQYDTTHVYVASADLDAFVNSFLATFGGKASPRAVFTVTPTPSKTASQYVQTPVGMLSVFGFETPIPYPFGSERTGYLVTNIDEAIKAARASGADVLVDSFDDPIGKDAVIQWPGGLTMQLYWHTKGAQLRAPPERAG